MAADQRSTSGAAGANPAPTGDDNYRVIRTPDGVINRFPKTATDEQIAAALGGGGKQDTNAQLSSPQKRSWLDVTSQFFNRGSSIGAQAGGIVGGIAGSTVGQPLAGASVGAAAGKGYETAITSARDVVRALPDLARNVLKQPRATAAGFVEGAKTGLMDAFASFVAGGAGEVSGQAVGKVLEKGAAPLMKRAVGKVAPKLVKDLHTSTGEIAQTLLDNGIHATRGGLEKLDALITQSNSELRGLLAGVTERIDPTRVAARTAETAEEFAKQVNPQEDLAAIASTTKNFLEHPTLSRPVQTGVRQTSTGVLDAAGKPITRATPITANVTRDLSALEAQDLKIGTTQRLKGKYGKLSDAATEAEKALARGLREEIEGVARRAGRGDIRALNEAERKLLAARAAVSAKIIKDDAGAGSGIILRHAVSHPMTFLASAASMMGLPLKSLVAQALKSPKVGSISALPIRAAVAALTSGSSSDDATGDESALSGSTGASSAAGAGSVRPR